MSRDVPCDKSANNELRQTEGSALKRSANDHNRRAKEDGLSPSKHITNPYRCDCAKETANIVGRDGNAWKVSVKHQFS